jgi:hypothetical protein
MTRYDRYSQSDKGRERSRRYKARNKEKVRAQNAALYTHRGIGMCSYPDCPNKGERHHPDYTQPLTVIWLCRKHHRETHYHPPTCQFFGCSSKTHAKGYCKKHYAQVFRREQGW